MVVASSFAGCGDSQRDGRDETGTGGTDHATGGSSAGSASGGASSSGGKASGGDASTGGVRATGGNGPGAGGSSTGGAGATGGASILDASDGKEDASDGAGCAATYDEAVLCDSPVGFWAMKTGTGQEPDLSGHGSAGTYQGPAPSVVALPNGDLAASFNGASNYLTIPSKAAFSIPTTGRLTWEAWIRPSILQFPNGSDGYVDWMGKCADYSPTCEWEARMYSTTNSQNRCNRLSAYVFNPGAGLGSGADWQPECGLFQPNVWLHIVAEYTTDRQPSDCDDAATYPGGIDIWVNGVKWDHAQHGQTGCLSQYKVVPKAGDSPVNIGTMARDSWFAGAVGKVAIYDYLLSEAQITNHLRVMTGKSPTGRCGDTCTF
jgi:hypothetical protein